MLSAVRYGLEDICVPREALGRANSPLGIQIVADEQKAVETGVSLSQSWSRQDELTLMALRCKALSEGKSMVEWAPLASCQVSFMTELEEICRPVCNALWYARSGSSRVRRRVRQFICSAYYSSLRRAETA